MSRHNSTKLKGNGAIIGIVAIVAVLVVLFAFPNVLSGFGFGGGGGAIIGVGPGSAGVVIKSFVATPVIVEGGEEVDFLLNVENIGGIDAKSIDYEIFGLDDSNSWTGTSSTESGETELEHADLARNIIGGQTVQEWQSTSKEKNTDIIYPVTARVDYDYSTEADVVLILYGRDNPNVENTGISQSSISQVKTTLGPLTVTPKGTIPLIGSNTNDFRISFDITNTGGGRTYTNNAKDDLDRIDVTFEGCTKTGSGSEVKLINNLRTVSCKVSPSIQTDEQETVSLKVTIDYNYIVEATANVNVLKQTEQ